MGARANYVLIEGGAISIYYSHWGAQSVPAVVIDGPEATIAYIRELGPDAGLMDDIWAEGGIPLDRSERVMPFHSVADGPLRVVADGQRRRRHGAGW